MLIDWFTVIAQALNFLILIWLLKRFLYKPILNAIDKRENKIKNQIQEAETKVAEAEKEQKEFHRKNKDFEAQRESLLKKAGKEAAAERKQLLEDARKEAEDLRARLEQSIREERQTLSREIMERTQREIFAIARKVLADLASASLEEYMVRVFIRRLNELEGAEKEELAATLIEPPREVLVRSVFELPPEQRAEVENALGKIAAVDIQPRFETASKQISGIELTTGGYKLAWSIEDYLSSLEKKLAQLLKENPELESEPTSKPAPNESTTR